MSDNIIKFSKKRKSTGRIVIDINELDAALRKEVVSEFERLLKDSEIPIEKDGDAYLPPTIQQVFLVFVDGYSHGYASGVEDGMDYGNK